MEGDVASHASRSAQAERSARGPEAEASPSTKPTQRGTGKALPPRPGVITPRQYTLAEDLPTTPHSPVPTQAQTLPDQAALSHAADADLKTPAFGVRKLAGREPWAVPGKKLPASTNAWAPAAAPRRTFDSSGKFKPAPPRPISESAAKEPPLEPIHFELDGGFDDDIPTEPARHLNNRGNGLRRALRRLTSNPSVLLVGFNDGIELSLSRALVLQSLGVLNGGGAEQTPGALLRLLREHAVDWLVLSGEARSESTQALLSEVSRANLPDLVGTLLVAENASLSARVLAMRLGASLVLPRSASLGLLAERIGRVVWGVGAGTDQAVERETTVEELVSTLADELEQRLSASGSQLGAIPRGNDGAALPNGTSAPGGTSTASGAVPQGATRLVFGAARELPRLIDDVVRRVGAQVERVERMPYELGARADATWLGEQPEHSQCLAGLRVGVVDDDAARADAVARDLRSRGAEVQVASPRLSECARDRLVRFDPCVLVVDRSQVGQSFGALESGPAAPPRHAEGLRGVRQLETDWRALWPDDAEQPLTHALVRDLAELARQDHGLLERLARGEACEFELAQTSLPRLLRSLEAAEAVELWVSSGRLQFQLWLTERVLVGVVEYADAARTQRVHEGPAALARLLELRVGRAVARSRPGSSGPPNLICPVDVALALARAEVSEQPANDPRLSTSTLPAQPAWPEQRPEHEVDARASWPPLSPSAPPAAAESGEYCFDLSPDRTATSSSSVGAPPDALLGADNLAPMPRPPLDPLIADRAKRVSARSMRRLALAGVAAGLGLTGVALLSSRPTPQAELPQRTQQSQQAVLGPRTQQPEQTRPPQVLAKPEAPSEPERPAAVIPPRKPTADADPLALARGVDFRAPGQGRVPPCSEEPAAAEPAADGGASAPAPTDEFARSAAQSLGVARRALVLGKLDEAHLAYCDVLRSEPEHPGYLAEFAKLLLVQGDGQAALKYAKLALSYDAKILNQVLLGDALALSGDYAQARAVWVAAWNLGPDQEAADKALKAIAKTQWLAAVRASARKQPSLAERYYRRVAVLDPTRSDAPAELASLLLAGGRPQEAKAWAARAAALDEHTEAERATTWQLLAKAAEAAGDLPLAARASGRAKAAAGSADGTPGGIKP